MKKVAPIIGIVDQDAGFGYEAREVVGRIIEAQSPRATMVAPYRVLSEATRE